MRKNSQRTFAKGIGHHTGKHDIGNCRRVLYPVFFAGRKGNQFKTVAQQVADFANICWWDETTGNQPMFMEVSNLDGILFVSLLATDRLDILRMCQGDLARRFQDIIDREPIFACGFHADMYTLMIREPQG